MSYFSANFLEAQSKFLAAAGEGVERLKIQARGPGDEELSIDIKVLGDRKAKRVLLHTSGIHGVEGFAGSAVQCAALAQKISPPADTALVFVHILNPFGMAWSRRVNENNVDLNRNNLKNYKIENSSYRKLDGFLNSPGPYWPQLLINMARRGFTPLKNAVAGGQYEFPKGIFFGGQTLQEGPSLYRSWLIKNISEPRVLMSVDVHTGLGAYGEEVIFAHTNGEAPDIGKPITAVTDPVGYLAVGGLESLNRELYSTSQWVHLTEEFGTHPMTQVLNILRQENIDFQRDGKSGPKLKKCFNPEDPIWREKAVKNGLETLTRSLAWLASR